MELGALVCTARSPKCADCPVADRCTWRAAGYPAWNGPPRRGQTLRRHRSAVPRRAAGRAALQRRAGGRRRTRRRLGRPDQRERCLASLLTDGLAVGGRPLGAARLNERVMTWLTNLPPPLALRNGAAIPVIGLGTWPLRGAESAAQVRTAIESGYRLIDTAENYQNEDGVGQGIRDSGIDRERDLRDHEVQPEVAQRRRGPHRVRGQPEAARHRLHRPAAGALAQSRPGSLRRRGARAAGPAGRRAAARDRHLELQARPTCTG